MNEQLGDAGSAPERPGVTERIRRFLFGAPRDLRDPKVSHHMSLMAFLAWVGLGADGLSSSAYGPEEAYLALGRHTYMAVFLVLATALTVFIISYTYSKIIEHFPVGGGGYLVATKLLGSKAGLISGSALLVDYVLTITVSISAGGDAIFSLLPASMQPYKLAVKLATIAVLIVLNIRGVKESVATLVPIFLTFVLTHILLIGGCALLHLADIGRVASTFSGNLRQGVAEVGVWGLVLLFFRAYSMGAGTYTGIEAVSNGVAILREPRVETGKRTMLYMATSLALTAGGLLLCYMLAGVRHTPNQTLNAVLAQDLAGGFRPGGLPLGPIFVYVTIFSEAILLLVAAQTGFIDGPRIMANMALDHWAPRRFAALSDRLTTQNGVLLMGLSSAAILYYTKGNIGLLLVMYSINVFLTFSLSQLGMLRFWSQRRGATAAWKKDFAAHAIGLCLCGGILVVMIVEKFGEGGWFTIILTGLTIALCAAVRHRYSRVAVRLRDVDNTFARLHEHLRPPAQVPAFDPQAPTAVILVGGYNGMGLHILTSILRLFPKAFQNIVFISVAVVDSAFFREGESAETLEQRTAHSLQRYVEVAGRMGLPARYEMRIGTDVAEEAAALCVSVAQEYPRTVFFAGALAFDRPYWYDRILHNETAYAIQRQIKSSGLAMVILPMLMPR